MNKRVASRWLILFLFTLVSLFPSSAQNRHPLLEMLSLIPDVDAFRIGFSTDSGQYPYVSYVDFAALQKYSSYGIVIDNADQFFALSEDEQAKWTQAFFARQINEVKLPFPTQSTGNKPDPVTLKMVGGPPVAEAVKTAFGFDYFAIERGMAFGMPPAQGTIFGLNYDIDAVDSALQTRGYVDHSTMGIKMWCQQDAGCDGLSVDVKGIEAQNIFDTRLGRKPPIISADGYLYSVFSQDLVDPLLETQIGKTPSFADVDDYRVLADSITDSTHLDGDLLSTYLFVGASFYQNIDLTTQYAHFADMPAEAFVQQWVEYQPMPIPQMVAFADRQDSSGQVILLAALYQDISQAETAQSELARRMNRFASEIDYGLDMPIIASLNRDVTPLEPYIYQDGTSGLAVVMVPYSVGQVLADPDTGLMQYDNSLISFWLQAFFNRSFYPLWDIKLPE